MYHAGMQSTEGVTITLATELTANNTPWILKLCKDQYLSLRLTGKLVRLFPALCFLEMLPYLGQQSKAMQSSLHQAGSQTSPSFSARDPNNRLLRSFQTISFNCLNRKISTEIYINVITLK